MAGICLFDFLTLAIHFCIKPELKSMIRSKHILKNLLLGIGISFALVACRDKTEPTPKPEEPPLLLKKITWTEKDFLTITYNEKHLPTQYTSQWVFDPDGNISTYQVTFDYDAQYRLIQVNANMVLKNKYHYQGNALQKTEEYDHKNRLVITHTYTFDAQNRLVQIIDDITDPDDQTTAKLKHTYEYDQRGNLTYLKDFQLNPTTQVYDLTYTQAWEGYDNGRDFTGEQPRQKARDSERWHRHGNADVYLSVQQQRLPQPANGCPSGGNQNGYDHGRI
jgi:hypothetical protein